MMARRGLGRSYERAGPLILRGGHSGRRRNIAWRSSMMARSWPGVIIPPARPNVPVDLNDAWAIAAGGKHSLALRYDGTVAAWGDNSSGQTNVPADLNDAMAIAAGGKHSLALRYDGTVVAWGSNSSGQTNVPAGLNNVRSIAAGGKHSLALRYDGTVVAWGDDSAGQRSVPVDLDNVQAIAAGDEHSLALRYDGTVVTWGEDDSGQWDVPGGLMGTAPLPQAASNLPGPLRGPGFGPSCDQSDGTNARVFLAHRAIGLSDYGCGPGGDGQRRGHELGAGREAVSGGGGALRGDVARGRADPVLPIKVRGIKQRTRRIPAQTCTGSAFHHGNVAASEGLSPP